MTLDGQQVKLAHLSYKSCFNVGRYGVDLEGFERVALPVLRVTLQERCIVVVDELGPMEFFSQPFCELVEKIMIGPNPVLGTIVKRSTPFGDRIKEMDGLEMIEVNHENRDGLVEILLKQFL